MKMYTACRQTGDFMDEVESIEEGLKLISIYEEEDKENGIYEEGFYDVVDEHHCTLIC